MDLWDEEAKKGGVEVEGSSVIEEARVGKGNLYILRPRVRAKHRQKISEDGTRKRCDDSTRTMTRNRTGDRGARGRGNQT